jgi:MinD superfamily P-loop ATPase
MILAVASGKGGTGKTTVATSLASVVADLGYPVSFLDCDVEGPNAHLFLDPTFDQRKDVSILVPLVDEEKCTGCGECAEVCQFHAIVILGGQPLVFPELCHGCGSCTIVCPEKAISEYPNKIGVLEAGNTPSGIHFSRGILDVGQPMAVPVIRQLKKWQRGLSPDIVILDSPPGVSCPAVETTRKTDFVLLVTEPTSFGLHDLRLASQLISELNIPAGIIINRDGIGGPGTEQFCDDAGLPILMRIPYSREIGEGIARGKLLIEIQPGYRMIFRQMVNQIERIIGCEKVRL